MLRTLLSAEQHNVASNPILQRPHHAARNALTYRSPSPRPRRSRHDVQLAGPRPDSPAVDDWEIDITQLHIEAKIASGAFSNLYKGTYCGQEVAVKILKDVHDDSSQYQEFLQVGAERLGEARAGGQVGRWESCVRHAAAVPAGQGCRVPAGLGACCIHTHYNDWPLALSEGGRSLDLMPADWLRRAMWLLICRRWRSCGKCGTKTWCSSSAHVRGNPTCASCLSTCLEAACTTTSGG